MILFSEVDQVLQEPFVKQNVPNSIFHLALDTYCTAKCHILFRYVSVGTNLAKLVLYEGALPGIL